MLSTTIEEQILVSPLFSSKNKQEQIDKQNTSTVVTKCEKEESIEEMVQRVERELDEELQYLQPASAAARVTATEEVPKSRVPSKLEELELENNNFNNNFLEVATEEATRPPDPNTTPMPWELTEKVEKIQPQQCNYVPVQKETGRKRATGKSVLLQRQQQVKPPEY